MKTRFIIIFIFLYANLFAQNDSLLFKFGNDIVVYKNTRNHKYKIEKEKEIIWKNLKFVQLITSSYLQVLDKENSFFYINEKGEKENDVQIIINTCGTVPHYTYEIIEKEDHYSLTKDETSYDYENIQPPIEIGSLVKEGIQKIYFHNGKQKMNMTTNDFLFFSTKVFPQALIIEKGNLKGLFYDNELTFYDEIMYNDGIFKVKKSNLVGFYKITQIKYKEIEQFTFGLAKFKLVNGKTGFVDKNGKEYYD